MITFEQRRDFGEKINATFSFLGENIRGLGLALLCIVGPLLLIGGMMQGYAQAEVMNSIGLKPGGASDPARMGEYYMTMFSRLSGAYYISIIFSMAGFILTALVIHCYIQLYRRQPAKGIEVGDVWRELQPFIGRSVLMLIVTYIIAMFATLLLIIPGIYVMIAFSLATPILVFEQAPVGTVISRCFTLIRGKWWSTVGLLLVMLIIGYIITLVFSIPALLFGVSVGIRAASSNSGISASPIMMAFFTALVTLGSLCIYSLVYTAMSFQYFNIVEEKEGGGLNQAIDQIGQTPTRPADDLLPGARRATEEEGEY